jgi:hypothetical protein
MAYEPRMPTKEEILAKAIELFQKDLMLKGLPVITLEEEELKEGSWFEKARSELMTGVRTELEKYLSYLETEADKIREELGIEKPLPTSERLTELESSLARVEDRYKATKERLKEAEEELRKIREAKPPPPALPPPPTPPSPTGLTEAEKIRLEDLFKRVFIEAGVSYAGKMAEFRDEIARLQEDLKDIPRPRAVELAEREITELAKRLIPYKPPAPIPAPVPVTAVPIRVRVALAEKRVRRIESMRCIVCGEPFMIDWDLKERVTAETTALVGTRPSHKPAILGLPEEFYHKCQTHRWENHGYASIYDAIAYLLAEAKRTNYRTIKLTKNDLRDVGLDDEDLEEIQRLEKRWIGESQF